ncbi:MAG: leucyl aminopeptidase, partial [Pseudomonadales bacterium]|nr:leucyl aminopeptidase [Pseudomonadales bacterium]
MDFQSKKAQLDKLKTDVLILPVYDDLALTASAKTVNQANNNQLSVILKNGDIKGNPGETLMLSGVSGANIKRVLLLGLGKKKEVSEAGFRKAMIAAVKTIATSNAKDACLALDDIAVNNRDVAWMARQ